MKAWKKQKPFALLEVRRMILKLKVKGNTHLHTVALMLRFWSSWSCHNEQDLSRKLHGNSVMTWAHHCRCALEYSYVSLTIVNTDPEYVHHVNTGCFWLGFKHQKSVWSAVLMFMSVCLAVVQVYSCTKRTKKTSDILQSSTFRTFYYWILEVGGYLLPWEGYMI